jgi:hypothetical protein
MKTTLDIPDDLYRRVKAKSALQGRAVREVTIDLYTRWLSRPEESASTDAGRDWLSAWLEHSIPARRSGPTAKEIVVAGRDRLTGRRRADR